MHRRARLALHRLGHEGGEGAVLGGRFPDRALEIEHLVGKLQRITMAQVDLELGRAFLVDQRVDLQPLRLAEVVDVVDQLVELVDAGDRIGLAGHDRTSRAADGRGQRQVGIIILGDEIEFDLGRDHRPPALLLVKLDHPFQHIARRVGHFLAIGADDVANHLRGRIAFPGHRRQR